MQMQMSNDKRKSNCAHPRACVVKGAKQAVQKGPNQPTCSATQKSTQVQVEAKTMQRKQSEGQGSANVNPLSVQLLLLLDQLCHIIATRDISNANIYL